LPNKARKTAEAVEAHLLGVGIREHLERIVRQMRGPKKPWLRFRCSHLVLRGNSSCLLREDRQLL
jgi:hypothetical protein